MSLVTSSPARKPDSLKSLRAVRSPSIALIWEIWRRNRWGLGLLAVLLAVGIGFARRASYLKADVARLEREILTSVQTVPVSQILPESLAGAGDPIVQLWLRVSGSVWERTGTLPSNGSPQDVETPGREISAPDSAQSLVFSGSNLKKIYDGQISASDTFSWEWPVRGEPQLRIRIGQRVIFDGLCTAQGYLLCSNSNGKVITDPSGNEGGTQRAKLLPDSRILPSDPLILNANTTLVAMDVPNLIDSTDYALTFHSHRTWRELGLGGARC